MCRGLYRGVISRWAEWSVGRNGQVENEDPSGNNFLFPPPSTRICPVSTSPKGQSSGAWNLAQLWLCRGADVGETVTASRHGVCLVLLLLFLLSFQMLLFQHLPGNLDRNHLV